MAAAEEIYDDSFESDEVPPVILDLIFVITMIVIHTKYIFKFTTFSLSYLEARILEKKEGRHYAESMRYWRAVWEWRKREFDDDDHSMDDWNERKIMQEVKGTVWTQLRILRWILRIGMGISGLMLFIIWIIFQINFIYGND